MNFVLALRKILHIISAASGAVPYRDAPTGKRETTVVGSQDPDVA
jgi:hypothetical protein